LIRDYDKTHPAERVNPSNSPSMKVPKPSSSMSPSLSATTSVRTSNTTSIKPTSTKSVKPTTSILQMARSAIETQKKVSTLMSHHIFVHLFCINA
jgi:hypothetical protein